MTDWFNYKFARSALALPGFKLKIIFTNGEVKIYDCNPLFQYKVYEPLKNIGLFQNVKVRDGVVCWNSSIDIAPEKLYHDSIIL